MKWVLLFLLVPTIAGAWEFKTNPDRYPSLGLSGSTVQGASGTHDNTLVGGIGILGTTGLEESTYHGDLRLPFTDWATFQVGVDRVERAWTYQANDNQVFTRSTMNYWRLDFGLRVYIKPDWK